MRQPNSPGAILQTEYLTPFGMTQKQLADHIGEDIRIINKIIKGKSSIKALMAIKLAATFGTTPQFWLYAQISCDIYSAERFCDKLPKRWTRAQ